MAVNFCVIGGDLLSWG